ncbi:MAG: hypothetical protein HYW49_13325 [Deltaproteobacteria bacterium]|nr:hypothetical protein [Deltaproteobacteria bacterium]
MNFARKPVITLAALTAASQIFAGCMLTDLKKNMDEMHDATVSMNKKMDTTNSGMSTTNAGVSETGYTAKKTFLALRKDSAFKARKEALRALRESKTMGAKLDAATSYMFAMEFQAWDPLLESNEEREVLFKEGMEDFIEDTKELMTNHAKVSPTSQNAKMWNLYAISAALHKINSLQKNVAKKSPFKIVSMIDLLAGGLDALTAINKSELSVNDISDDDYRTVVMRWKEDAIYLLRVRQNFINAFAFAMSAMEEDGDEPSLVRKGILLVGAGMLGIDWTPTLADRDTKQIQYYNIMLDYSLATRDILDRNGIDAKSSKSILKIYRNMDWSSEGLDEQPKEASTQSLAQRERRDALVKLRDTFTKVADAE